MTTYALFIASDPEPVSISDWTHLDEVYDRARLSSGGTMVKLRATDAGGAVADDYVLDVATFINGIRLEVREDGPEQFSYLGDGKLLATAHLRQDEWLLTPDEGLDLKGRDPIAYVSATEHDREDAEARLGKIVEDWLS